MPNTKNLNVAAQGASASRVPTKRVIRPYSRLKSEERGKSQGLFRVKFYGVGAWRRDADPQKADIHFADNYQAASAFEAAGMAIDAVQKEYPQYDIVLRSLKCSLLNPIAR